MWPVITTTVFDDWFAALGDDEQAELLALIQLLHTFGPRLSRPHVGTLAGSKYSNMKELRGRTPGAVLRVAFVFDPNRQAVLLVGGNKIGVGQKQFYKSLIRTAERIYEQYLKER